MQMDENIKICAACGHANSEDHNFCESCGCRLDKTAHENENTSPLKPDSESIPVKKLEKKKILIIAGIMLIAIAAVVSIVLASSAAKEAEYQEQVSAEYSTKITEADRYMKDFDYENAEASYLRAIDIDPKQDTAYLKLSDTYVEQEQYEKAVDILEQGKNDCGKKSIKKRIERVYPYYGYECYIKEDLNAEEEILENQDSVYWRSGLAGAMVIDVNDDDIPELLTFSTIEENQPVSITIREYSCNKKKISLTSEITHSCAKDGYIENYGDIFVKEFEGKSYIGILSVYRNRVYDEPEAQKLWIYGFEKDTIKLKEEFTIDISNDFDREHPEMKYVFELNGNQVGECSAERESRISMFDDEDRRTFNEQYKTGYNAFEECLKKYGMEHLLGIQEGKEYFSSGFENYEPDAETETYIFDYEYRGYKYSSEYEYVFATKDYTELVKLLDD